MRNLGFALLVVLLVLPQVSLGQKRKGRPKVPASQRLSASRVAALALPLVVEIFADGPDGVRQGSGFLAAPGTVLTNEHVIHGAVVITVMPVDEREIRSTARFLYSDAKSDLALLHVDGFGNDFLEIDEVHKPFTGDTIFVVGNPSGLAGTFSPGMISALRTLDGLEYIQFTAPISPGSSGGPVLNTFGKVIGVTVLKWHGENLNFAIPLSRVLEFAKDYIRFEADKKARLESERPAYDDFSDIDQLVQKLQGSPRVNSTARPPAKRKKHP